MIYLNGIRNTHEHSLEQFGQISQVEGVVRLGRGGQQLGGDGVVHGDTSVYHLTAVLRQ